MAAARRRRRLFPLRPHPLPPQRLLLVAATAAAAFTLLFLFLVLLSTASPSSPPPRHRVAARSSPSTPHHCADAETTSLGELGDAMVSMLPTDLPFTVFVPSADAFRRVLNLRPPNGSAATHATEKEKQTAGGDDDDEADTYAALSRVLGFSAVPRHLLAADVASRGESRSARVLLVDSVSGLRIHVAREEAALVANGVRSECVDVVRGETVVHVMASVLMDSKFERSFAARSGS